MQNDNSEGNVWISPACRVSLIRQQGNMTSWFRRSPNPEIMQPDHEHLQLDQAACFETLQCHWQEASAIMVKKGSVTSDDANGVVNYLHQMVLLLLEESRSEDFNGPMLDYFLSEEVMELLFMWSNNTGEHLNKMKLEQLHLYVLLLAENQQNMLMQKPLLRPLMKLIATCSEWSSVDVERNLLGLLNMICISLNQFPSLLDFFFIKTAERSVDRFVLFSVLAKFMHRDGTIGCQARDSLLLCMALSTRFDYIAQHIVEKSNFCEALASGLSGLYSQCRNDKLEELPNDWHAIRTEDLKHLPELVTLIDCLDFCNSVCQVAPPLVRDKLIDYIYHAFFVQVLGTAVCQGVTQEVMITIAYLKLFLFHITDPSLMKAFIRFLVAEDIDGTVVLDTIVCGVNADDHLCLVSLAFIEAILDLNCEDVIVHLALKYLIPCSHVMLSQRKCFKKIDLQGSAAEKFLSLIPSVCIPNRDDHELSHSGVSAINTTSARNAIHKRAIIKQTGFRIVKSSGKSVENNQNHSAADMTLSVDQFKTSYIDYLHDAEHRVRHCVQACSCWSAPYDGMCPPREAVVTLAPSPTSEAKHLIGVKKCESHDILDKISKEESEKHVLPVVNGVILDNSSEAEADILTGSRKGTLSSSDNVRLSTMTSISSFDSSCDTDVFIENFEPILPLAVSWDKLNSDQFQVALSRIKVPELISTESEIGTFCGELDEACKIENTSESANLEDLISSDESKSVETSGELPDMVQESVETEAAINNITSRNDAKKMQRTVHEHHTKSGKRSSLKSLELNIIPEKDDYIPSSEHTTPLSPLAATFGKPHMGLFFTVLFGKLENMIENSLYANLQLTAVISRLACYPQPLLRSFLLNPDLVFQPSVRSLIQILASVKQKVDSFSSGEENFEILLLQARQWLLSREKTYFQEITHPPTVEKKVQRSSSFMKTGKRVSLSKLFSRKSDAKMLPRLQQLNDRSGYHYINTKSADVLIGPTVNPDTRNAVFCAIIMEEFLKELSAICQEHILVQTEMLGDDD